MKKIVIAIVLLSVAPSLKAQNAKPTKEVTQRFINSTLAQVVGEFYLEDFPIKYQKFDVDFNNFEQQLEDNSGYWDLVKVQLIQWENFIGYRELPSSKAKTKKISIHFTNKMECINSHRGTSPKTSSYDNFINILVPVDKEESIIKAFERLAEIAKEENKDPFKN